jgi:hypothetical protein
VLEKGDAKPYTHRSNAVAVIAFLMGFAELADPGPPEIPGRGFGGRGRVRGPARNRTHMPNAGQRRRVPIRPPPAHPGCSLQARRPA